MPRRRKEYVEAGLCGNGLHPWIDSPCRECHRTVHAAWREANREKTREWNRLDYEKNREARLATASQWREANRDRYREMLRAWGASNRDRGRIKTARRRALMRSNGVVEILDRDIKRMLASPCAHAHLGDCDGPIHLDHIIPIARGGRHAVGNMQPLCRRHNTSKQDRFEVEVKARARRKVAA